MRTLDGRRAVDVGLAGAPATPLLILFGLNLVDELDRIAFAALTPELRDAFDLRDDQIVAIGAVSAVFILLGALPLGYLGDRVSRLRIAGIAGLVWGSMSVLMGLAWAVPILFVARLGSGVARTSNEVVHPSLLADYYPPAIHPQVFRIHRLATPLSAAMALVIGGIAALLGWRWTFILAAVPTFVLLTLLSRLQEPVRGAHTVGVTDSVATGPLSFRTCTRILFRIRTLRRCWLGGFLLGIAFIASAQLLSLFFEDVFRFGPLARGVVQFAHGTGIVIGIVLGARAASHATAHNRFERLPAVIAVSFMTSALGLAGMAASPWPVLAVPFVTVLGIGLGVYQPAYYPLVARIAPARVRTQAYGWALVFVGLGALFAIPLARFGEHESYRIAFVILAGIVLAGAGVIASAAGRVVADVEKADTVP